MLKKIVVPLDGSSLAEKALPYAVVLATEFKSELLLLRVIEDGEGTTSTPVTTYLKHLQAFLTGQGLPDHAPPYTVRSLVANGVAAEQIIETVNDYQANLIIMSTHGRGGLHKTVTGSVAQKVLHETSVPVLLIRPESNDQLELAETFRSVSPDFIGRPIIVPLDGTPFSESALKYATELGEATNAPVDLIEVLPTAEELAIEAGPATIGYYPREVDLQTMKEEALDYLLTVETERIPAARVVNTHVVNGKPAPEIVRHARETNAGMVVMASHVRVGMGKAVLGSVAEEVLRQSNVPVLIVNRRAGHVEEIQASD